MVEKHMVSLVTSEMQKHAHSGVLLRAHWKGWHWKGWKHQCRQVWWHQRQREQDRDRGHCGSRTGFVLWLTGVVWSSVNPERSLWLKSPARLSIPIIVTSPWFPLPLQTQRYKWLKNTQVLAGCPAGEGTQTKFLDLWIPPSQGRVQVLRSRQAVTANPSPWFELNFKDISMTTTDFLGWRS